MRESTKNDEAPSMSRWDERAQRWGDARRCEAETQDAEAKRRSSIPPTTLDRVVRAKIAIRWRSNPARDFDVLIDWWMHHEAVPETLDTQDPEAVRNWLVSLDAELALAWQWYGQKCRVDGSRRKHRVFRAAASVAESVVRELEGQSASAPSEHLPETLLDVRKFIQKNLIPRVERVASLLVGRPEPERADYAPSAEHGSLPLKDSQTALSAGGSTVPSAKKKKPTPDEARQAIVGWLTGGDTEEERDRRLGASQADVVRATKLSKSTVSKFLAPVKHGVLERLRSSRKTLAKDGEFPSATDESDDPSEISARREPPVSG